jgi:4-hydroxy-3-polyprenylbenzoate decarboxylase
VQTHLVLSRWARATIHLETGLSAGDVAGLADVVYSWDDQAAVISSGSFLTHGMVVAPCSMKTLAGIRTGYADGLIARAADVNLKERRRLVLVPRETPLSEIHLENMLALTRMGARIVPPMPAFYNHPASIGDIALGQGRLWQAGGWHSRSTPSSGNTPCVPALTLRSEHPTIRR